MPCHFVVFHFLKAKKRQLKTRTLISGDDASCVQGETTIKPNLFVLAARIMFVVPTGNLLKWSSVQIVTNIRFLHFLILLINISFLLFVWVVKRPHSAINQYCAIKIFPDCNELISFYMLNIGQ